MPNTDLVGLWINNKKGTKYCVIGECINCTNAQDGQGMVIYQSVDEPSLVFVREHSEFLEKFTNINAERLQ